MRFSNAFARMGTLAVLFMLILMGAEGCDEPSPDADRAQAHKQERMLAQSNQVVGMPSITNYQEKQFARLIQELRDEEIGTYTYIVDMNGRYHFVCHSTGYGLPYSVQFTNPEKIADKTYDGGFAIISQADPNGLFMPDNVTATWVICSDGEGGISPVYLEPEILVTTMPMPSPTPGAPEAVPFGK